ncbi:MAG: hypothetical protein WC223_10775 [Bacteroidales bacterium]|jgi:hypothetical protein
MRKKILISVLLALIGLSTNAQQKDCKYSKNSVDEFTKQTEVRTKLQEIYFEKKLAPAGSSGYGSWLCKKYIKVSACNFNGSNYLLMWITNCKCDVGRVSSISFLLQNGVVINISGKIEMEYRDECEDYWQFSSVSDTVWSMLKTIPVKKIRVEYKENMQLTFEIDERDNNKIMEAINCIDILGIPKPKNK